MDIERCYGLIEESGCRPLDTPMVIDFVLEAHSWAAIYALLAWVNLMRNDIERSRLLLTKAEEHCRDDHELAYVLHLKSLALSRMGHFETALETCLRCLEVCKATPNKHLLVRVLLSLAVMYNITGRHDLARVYTEKVMAV